ncbi:unnamed protein product [Discosporangium mesarthrocarpum]
MLFPSFIFLPSILGPVVWLCRARCAVVQTRWTGWMKRMSEGEVHTSVYCPLFHHLPVHCPPVLRRPPLYHLRVHPPVHLLVPCLPERRPPAHLCPKTSVGIRQRQWQPCRR